MPSPGAFRPRQGRLRRSAGQIGLPIMWMEAGGYSLDAYVDHPLWKLPNTFPFLRMDIRQAYAADGTWSWAYFDQPITPEQFADNVENLYTAYEAAYGPVFQGVGKRLRYAVLLVGVDQKDCAVRLTTDIRDYQDRKRQRPWCLLAEKEKGRSRNRMRRNRTTQGVTPKLGADGRTSFFHHHGRESTRAWASACFAAARDRLSSMGKPFPEILVTDLESEGKDRNTGYPVYNGVFPLFDSFVTGWYYKLERDFALQPQHQAYLLDGDTTFGQWMAQRQATLSGAALPAHNLRYYINHPHENDLYWRMIAANQMSFIKSLSVAIYEPAKAAFGDTLRCGEWQQYANGRTFPAEVRPRLMSYWKNGVFGLDFQIPAYYPQGLATWEGGFDSPIPFGDTDPGWHLPTNWRSRLQPAVSTPGDLLFDASVEQQSAVDWSAARSNGAALFPSTSVEFLLKLGDYPAYQRVLLDRLLRTVIDGARDIWMFEPRFNLPPPTIPPDPPNPHAPTDPPNPDDLRKAVYELALAINARVEAMNSRRSRVARAGQVSGAFLGENKP